MIGRKSSFMVQQIQPLGRSWISTPHSSPAVRNNTPSTETSPNSLTNTASRRLGFFFNKPLISVVLPEPKKPVTIVTGIFINQGTVRKRRDRREGALEPPQYYLFVVATARAGSRAY